ncbi:MAG: hypothetical protein QOI10_2791 [Solirubrobacterales bacterium]|jgi:hypothetical protein|nr:hypothetical protein [Solirubrobacterales bacterium]
MRSILARIGAHPWPVLAIAIAIAAVVILAAGNGLSFSGDELYYFGRQADVALPPVHYGSFSLEYLLAPHNGHLQPAGKLIYEAMFVIFGADYTPFRVLELLLVMVSIGLFFELARTRLGAPVALLLAILLCFLGAAWEVLLWPFDLHTIGALAAGLGALLVLERGGRRADPIACLLLCVSIAFVELGVAIAAAVAVSILIRGDRRRRLWIVAVPGVLYIAWYLWARRFELTPVGLENAADVIGSWFDSLRAVGSSLTGTLATGDGAPVPVVGLSAFGAVLAGGAIALFALRLRRGALPPTFWPLLTALLVYWTFIGLAERSADSSRYVFAGAVLVLLVAADLLRDRRPGPGAIAILALIVALALPGNIAKLEDGGDYLAKDAELTRGEFAMLEVAGPHAKPGYVAAYDGVARQVGASPYLVMDAAIYLDAVRRIGSLADSLDVVRGRELILRQTYDVVLARTLDLKLEPVAAPDQRRLACDTPAGAPGVSPVPAQGVFVQALDADVELRISRFVPNLPIFTLGTVAAGDWVRLDLPGADSAPDPWKLFFDAPIRACVER